MLRAQLLPHHADRLDIVDRKPANECGLSQSVQRKRVGVARKALHPGKRCLARHTEFLTNSKRKGDILWKVERPLVAPDFGADKAAAVFLCGSFQPLRHNGLGSEQNAALRHGMAQRLRDLRQRIAHHIRMIATDIRDDADVRAQNITLRRLLEFRRNGHAFHHQHLRVLRRRAAQDRNLLFDIRFSPAADRFLTAIDIDGQGVRSRRLAEDAKASRTEPRLDQAADC